MTVKRIQLVAQIVGFVTIGVLAILGALTIAGGGRPVWAARGQSSSTMSPRVDNVIAYQGMLREPDGSVVNGTYAMTFRLYDSADATVALHTQTVPNVVVRDGLFTVLLGDLEPLDVSFFQDPVYVGIQVEDDAEMQPRQRLHPVPYAIQLTDGVYVDGSGNVGIGTTDPTVQLDVDGDVEITGDLDVKRQYQTFHVQTSGKSATEMGSWDLCALVGTEVAGVDNDRDDWGHCLIYTYATGDAWGSYGPYNRGPGDDDRDTWYLRGWANAKVDYVNCQAICINFGE